jgi:predicted DNA-binding antitoxin AbrB/MazE fold protein
MTITVEAVYENGVLKPTGPLPFAEHEIVELVVRKPADVQAALDAVGRSYGIVGWKGDGRTIERVALEPEFGLEESP